MSGDIQISPHVGELFVKYGVRRQYRSGEVLLEKGALSAQAGFLVKGQLRTFCLGPSGDEISLFYLGPGNLFGHLRHGSAHHGMGRVVPEADQGPRYRGP